MIFIKPSQLNLKVYIFNFFKKNYHEAIRLLSSVEIVYKKYKLSKYEKCDDFNAKKRLNLHVYSLWVFFIWLYPFLSFILFIRLGQNLLQCCTIRYQTCVSK